MMKEIKNQDDLEVLSNKQLFEPNNLTYEAMENDEDVYGPFDSIEELMEALDS